MRQENHFYKVIDEHTMLIAADNPAEPQDLRGPGHPDVLPVQRRRHRGRQRAARAPADDADLGQQGGELDHAARHGRQGRRRRADRRAERQAARRGRRGRRAAPAQHEQGPGPRHPALRLRSRRPDPRGSGTGKPNLGVPVPERHLHVGSAQGDLHPVLRVHDPVDHVLVHQEQHGRRAPRQAAAADLGGAEGAARHRRPRADSGHHASTPGRPSAATSCRSRRSSTRTSASRSRSSRAFTTTRK